MVLLDNNVADITTLDPGEVFVGGREHSLVPIMEERYNEGLYTIAVINKRSDIQSLYDIRDKHACFGGVGTLAGWVTPISKVKKKLLTVKTWKNIINFKIKLLLQAHEKRRNGNCRL